jgi:sarcosine oxidase
MEAYDCIVIGVGAVGSVALAQLAARGAHVLGLERFEPGHERGSSHGHTRAIRLAYFEHPDYVPLLRRAFELWRELSARARRRDASPACG